MRKREDWTFIQNDYLKVGLLETHGGAIGYIRPTDLDYNLVNHEDNGRLIQQSFYGDFDGSKWGSREWHYNPVQGGDHKGVNSDILDFNVSGTKAFVKTVPRHWASGQLLTECNMTQSIELEGPVLKIHYGFEYWGDELHQPRHQETPAVFAIEELDTFVTYDGEEPWTDQPLKIWKPSWPNEYTNISENWAAYVGKDGRGIGIFVPGVVLATCYRFPGKGFFKIKKVSYVAPLQTFGLYPGLSISYDVYITTGNVEEIRKRFREIHCSLDTSVC